MSTTLAKKRDHADPLLASMNPALQKACLAVRRELVKVARGTIMAHYRIGVIAGKVTSASNRYGVHAVDLLAKAVDLDRTTIYDHQNVAECLTEREIKALLKRKGKYGVPLSWSHLVELAKVKDRRRREEHTAEVLREGLSVRDLRARIDQSGSDESELELSEGDASDEDASEEETPGKEAATTPRPALAPAVLNGLKEMTVQGTSWVDESARWQAEVFQPILQIGTKSLNDQLLESINKAREAQLRLRDACEQNLRQLDKIVADAATPARKRRRGQLS